MKRRIFWFCNHTSLRQFQVPMLIDLGYEVFCPKSCSYGVGDNSTSISFEYDSSLSLPEEILEQLNSCDFYEELSPKTVRLLDEYFDIVFISIPTVRYIVPLLNCFHGAIVMLAFGLDKSQSYVNALCTQGGFGLLEQIHRLQNRFWFAPSYEGIADIEPPFLQERSVFLPIGMKDAQSRNEWVGGDERLLFISPKILTHPYYNHIYQDFRKNFGDLPHVIGGSQLQPIENDPTVAGFLPQEQYDYNMKHLCAMYYHSREPRHLHYHPLEAIKHGMPLVFMSGGMLDRLGGKNLPGRCETVEEARKKLIRLSQGDKKLIASITSSQPVLLEKFTYEYCLPFWQQGMARIEASLAGQEMILKKNRRVGFVLPAAYTGGVLDYSIRFLLSLQKALKEHNDPTEIFFAYPEDEVFQKKNYFRKLSKAGIPVRSYYAEEWEQLRAIRTLRITGLLSGEENKLHFEPKYCVLRDGIADFMDCDQLVLLADVLPKHYPLFSLVPYTVVIHDYIQRYVPQITSKETNELRLALQRKARNVLVMTRPAWEDAVQYGHLDPKSVHLMPMMLTVNSEADSVEEQMTSASENSSCFLWTTNAMPHKNHLRALEALSLYYRGGGQLKCVVTGANTQYLAPGVSLEGASVAKEYVHEVQSVIRKDKLLGRYVEIRGELSKDMYYDTLKSAAFLFHPGYANNGNMSMVEAAGVGVPTLSSDYPASRYMADFAGIQACYMDPFDPEDMAEHLFDMEKHWRHYAQLLPDRSRLEQIDYLALSEEVYRVFRDVISA